MTDSTILSPLQTHPPPPTRFLNRPVHDVTPITSITSTPTAVGSAQPPRSEKIPPFFEVSLGPRVDLDQVYWNGLHALRRFYIRNHCPDPILVKLRTNLPGQVAFQLNNENLPDLESASVDSGDRVDASSVLQGGPAPHLIKHEFASYSGPLVSEGTAHAAAVAAAAATMSPADRARLLSSNASSSSSLPSFTSNTMSPSVSLDSLYSAGSLAFSSDNVSSLASPSASGPYHTLSAAGSVTSLASGFSTPSGSGNMFRPTPTSMPVVPSTLRDATTLDSAMSAALTPTASARGPTHPMMSSLFSDRGSDSASAAPSSSHHAHASKSFQPLVTVTNTATAAALGAYGGGLGGAHEFNQLFNFPGEVRKVILAFLPNADDGAAHYDSSTSSSAIAGTSGTSASSASGQPGSNLSATPPSNSLLEDTPATFTPADDEANTYDFKEVAGMLMFYGYRVPREIAAAASDARSPSDSTAIVLASSLPPPPEPQQPPVQAIRSLVPSRANSVSGTAAAATASGAKADCNMVVKFKARMCKSVLWSEVAHQGILFEDCVLDGTFIRDFTVWNKSEIDLYWTLNTAAVSHALTFTDYDTGEPLDTSKPIPAYSHCRVRVTYKPKQLGDFSYEIQLENVNDAANVEVVRIHCVVRSALQDESLVVLSGHQLDFGDITAGQWNTARLVVKNVSEQPMEVKFLAEGSSGPVVFDLSQGALDLDVDPNTLGLFHELGSGTNDPRGGSGGGGPGHSPVDGYGSIAMGSPPNDWIMPMRSNGSSRTSSPVPSRSISVDMSLADLAGRAGLAGNFGGGGGGGMAVSDGKRHSGHSPLPGGGHGSRSAMSRRAGTGNVGAGAGMATDGADGDEYDSDSESVVSTRSMRSANSTLAGSGFAGPGSTTTGGISGGNGAMRGSNLGASPSESNEMTLKPGAERTVIVSYFPEKSMSASDYNAGTLVKRTFRVVLQYAKNRRVIQCKARTCTSFISVSPSTVSFGDTDVGTLKSAPVRITNLSEVPARVELSFASKVLSCLRDDIRIPPKQSVEVKIDIYPRKVNPDYRKQITVLNLLNRDNDQIIEVRSTNIDKQRITWHSFFYRIMTPSSTNYLDFGAVVGNHYSSNLVLSISASSDSVTLYLKRKSTGAKLSNLTAKKLTLGSMADRKTIKRANSDLLAPPSSSSATTAYLDLAVPQKQIPSSAKQSVAVVEAEPGTPSNSVDEVVHILQNLNMATLPSFPPNLEQKFVKLTVALRKSLDAVIRNGDLVPITGSHITIAPAPGVRDRRKKLDARLLFSLVEFDSSLLPTMQTVLPVRELLVRCIRNINFGNIDLHAAMSKTIIVRNKSDVLLSYAIKKTGSIASGDVLLENRFVTFTFQPTMPGLFFEKLTVENIMNPETSQVISLKANVRKPESFSIHTESLDFGVCMVNELSAERILTLHNTHRTQRTFTVRVEDESLNGVQFEFWVIGSATMEHGVQDVEDKIEVLEQKLKIAKRKGRKDKVDKITETISKLRRGAETIVPRSPAPSSVTTASATPVVSQPPERKLNSLTLPVEPFAIMKIGVAARAKPLPRGSMSASTHSETSGAHKNTDLLKKVAYSCLVCYDQTSFIATLETTVHPSGDSTPRQRSLSSVGPALAAPIGLPSMDVSHAFSNGQPVVESLRPVVANPAEPPTAPHSSKLSTDDKKVEPVPVSTATAYLETLVVDVGKFPIGQDNTFYFVLINTGTAPASYSTEDPAVAPSDRLGEVLPGERRVINATVVPKSSGRQSYALGVVCQGFPQIFTVHFTAVYKDGLMFTQGVLPSASDSNTTSDVGSAVPIQEVDLGYCYNPKRFTARSAVRITNNMPEPVSVSAGSTLSQQVGAFANLDCTLPFSEVVLEPHQTAVAYLAVQPNLTQPPLVMGKKSLVTFESRQLVGGFKFTSYSRSAGGTGTGDEICAQHLKFQAVIGPSVLSVSSTFINLGSVSKVCGIETSFTVFNLSDRMPLHYRITCSNPDLVTIHDYMPVLRGASTNASASTGTTAEEDQVANRISSPRATVAITVNPRAFGYFCETQVSAIMVTLLVDPQTMLLQAPAQLPPAKEWDHIFVYQASNQASAGLTTADVEGMSQVVTITNSSSRPLRVLPYSDLRLEVQPNGARTGDRCFSASTDGRAQPCGPVMVAAPGADWTCTIGTPLSPEQLTEDDMQALQQGKSIKVRECSPSFKIIKVVELLGYYCVSRAEVVSPKPGKSVQFSVTVKNTASSPTKLAVGASSTSIRYDGPDALEMEPYSSVDLDGTHEWSNELVVPVVAKVTSLDLTVEGRGELDDSKTLVLPNLLVPNLAGTPIDAWFTLTNPTSTEVRFNVEAQLIQPLTAFMHLHVLSRFSNTPVKIKAIVRDFAKLSEDTCPQWLLDERGIQIGQILFENESGRLTPCFDLDTAALDLVVGGSPVNIAVSNNSPHHSLTFALSLEYVTVPPSSSVSVPVQLVKSEFTDSGDTITLHFVDTDSIHQFQRSVRLRFSEPQSPTSLSVSPQPPTTDDESVGSSNQPNARSAPTTPIDGPSSAPPGSSSAVAGCSNSAPSSSASSHDLIAIKGCSKRGRLHELDLGQQDLGAGTVTRKLVLELQRPAKCSYRIWSTPPDCSDWLSLSRTEGTLESTSKSHSVTLSFSTNVRNVFSTYLYVKVTLEVVARVNARKARAFDVVCNGLGDQPTITFENVFYGQEYTSRSFTIVNHEAIPLEFTLKMQNLDPTDATEVLFSTSKSIAKLFKTVVVPAESRATVAQSSSVATRPGSPETDPLDLAVVDAALARLEPPPPAHPTPACLRSNIVEVKEFDVVQVLHVSSSDVVISATISPDGTTLHCSQPFTDIAVSNLSATDSLNVHVHGAVFPFIVEPEGCTPQEPTAMLLAPLEQRRVLIQLDADEAVRQIDALRREKYCQAYLVVYNRDQCLERVFVTLRLSLGHLQSFALAWWTSSRSPTFSQLEWLTIDFIRRFGDLAWDKVVDNPALVDQAHFQYRVVVDQLVYLCTISSTLDHILHAASLFFVSILSPATSASAASAGGAAGGGTGERYVPEEWVDGLRYFLSFFTARHPVLDALRRIYLVRRNGGMTGVGAAAVGSL
ncbi:hypothetical protein BCR44DRAFT_1436350, partial [Catenaria anguillulae PL171]